VLLFLKFFGKLPEFTISYSLSSILSRSPNVGGAISLPYKESANGTGYNFLRL
jgi:hypothetical protein